MSGAVSGLSYKQAHLGFIQESIKRMAQNSFAVKGWAIALCSAAIALSNKEARLGSPAFILLPLMLLWGLDTFYLARERAFRVLYDAKRLQPDDQVDFDMTVPRPLPPMARHLEMRRFIERLAVPHRDDDNVLYLCRPNRRRPSWRPPTKLMAVTFGAI